MGRAFAGMESVGGKEKFLDHFEKIYDNEYETTYLSIREFNHDVDDDLVFKYRYTVTLFDMAFMSGDDKDPLVVEMLLVPSFDSLSDKAKDKLADLFTVDYSEESENWKYKDIAEYSFGVRMGYKSIDVTIEELADVTTDLTILKPVQDTFEDIANVYLSLDRMRGFYLDRAWNQLGTTGWDTLFHAIKDEPLFKWEAI